MDILLFFLGFVFLLKGADLLIEGASSLALKLKIKPVIVGLTVVAFGTSAPELIVNLKSVLSGYSSMAFANVLGSNISNVLLILGISSFLKKLEFSKKNIFYEIPFFLMISLIFSVMIFWSYPVLNLNFYEGGVLLVFFIIFLAYAWYNKNLIEEEDLEEKNSYLSFLYLVLGSLGLYYGGEYIVNGAVLIGEFFNLSEAFLGATVLAIGTSLPELSASLVAIYKNKSDLAVGNIIGSNIFNILFVLGVSSLFANLKYQVLLNIDLILSFLSMLILFLLIFKSSFLNRKKSYILLLFYLFYLIFVYLRG
jgi:cation:H+ antiporter